MKPKISIFNSLQFKLIASFTVVIFISLLLAGSIYVVLLGDYAKQSEAARMQRAAVPLASAVRQMVHASYDKDLIAQYLNDEAQQINSRIILLNNIGEVAIDTDTKNSLEGQKIGQLAGNAVQAGELTTNNQGTFLFVNAPLKLTPGMGMLWQSPLNTLLILKPTSEVRNEALERLIPRLVMAGGVAFLVSILLASFLAQSMTGPVKKIIQASEEMARGRYDQTIPVESSDEIGQLAASFNKMAKRVAEADQMQRDFVANVSHDLKTPLTSIAGFSQALLDGTANNQEDLRRSAQIIHDETNRLIRLTQDLLDLARLESGQITIAREPVDITALASKTVTRFESKAKSRQVNLKLDLAPRLPKVKGDEDRLAQVLTNLLDNAIKFTTAGGAVLLEASSDAHSVKIEITDSGPGIPPEELDRIFERFYQVDKARASGEGGTGLGLAIAKEIVEAHGGQISASSEVDKGTTFTVLLPVY